MWRGRTFFAVFALESALCEYYYDKFTHSDVHAQLRHARAAPARISPGHTHAVNGALARTTADARLGPSGPPRGLSVRARAQTQPTAAELSALVLRDVALASCRREPARHGLGGVNMRIGQRTGAGGT